MPKQSSEWIANAIIVQEDILLFFNKDDAQIARNWSKSKAIDDQFDDKSLAPI